MSKMSEMDQTIRELRNDAAVINDTADWLYRQFSNSDEPETVTQTAPVTEPETNPEPKLEDVRAVLAEKSRAGHTAEIRTLLKKYGADRLSAVDPKNYAALLANAEGLK